MSYEALLSATNGTAPLSTKDLEPYVVILSVSVSAFLSGLAMGLTSFGSAIVFHMCWQLFLLAAGVENDDLSQLVALLSIMDCGTVPLLMWISRKDVDMGIFIYLTPLMAGLTFLGLYVLVSSPAPLLKFILGIVFLVFAVWRIGLEAMQTNTGQALAHRMSSSDLFVVRALAVLLRTIFPNTSHPPAADADAPPALPAGSPGEPRAIDGQGAGSAMEMTVKIPTSSERDSSRHNEQSASVPSLLKEPKPAPASPPASDKRLVRLLCFDLQITRLSTRMKLFALGSGAASGVLRGLFGVGGPPLMVFVTLSGLDKTAIRATVTATSVVTLPILTGYLLIYQEKAHADEWPKYVAAVSCAAVGLLLGNRLFRMVNTVTVLRFILLLLVVASLTMMNLSFVVTMALFGSLCFALVVYWVRKQVRTARLARPHYEAFQDHDEVAHIEVDHDRDHEGHSPETR